jgi:hypothetical protein
VTPQALAPFTRFQLSFFEGVKGKRPKSGTEGKKKKEKRGKKMRSTTAAKQRDENKNPRCKGYCWYQMPMKGIAAATPIPVSKVMARGIGRIENGKLWRKGEKKKKEGKATNQHEKKRKEGEQERREGSEKAAKSTSPGF